MHVGSSILADLLKLSNPDMSTGTQGTVINTDLSGMDFPTSSSFNSSNMGTATNSKSNWGSLVDPTKSDSPGVMDQFNDWFNNSGFLQKKDASGMTSGGWGTAGLGIAQGLGNAWMGMQSLKVAKDTLKANKEQFALNYGAQKQTTNTALEDRQRARVAANSTAYQSVGDYMNKNRIV